MAERSVLQRLVVVSVSALVCAVACEDGDGGPEGDVPDPGRDAGAREDAAASVDAGAGDGGADDELGGGGADETCSNSCEYAHDGECDDGGPDSAFDVCAVGTDCGDCGPRTGNGGDDSCEPACGGRECGPDGCGGSCGQCTNGSCDVSGNCVPGGGGDECDPSSPAYCEGDVAVRCEVIGGVPSLVRESCAGSCRSGECVSGRPERMTITGSYGDASPTIVGSEPSVLFSATATPTFSVDSSSLPDLFGREPRFTSPTPGSCDPTVNFTLNRAQVGATINGQGPACVTFIEAAAERGFRVEFEDVPFQDGLGGTLDVVVDMSP